MASKIVISGGLASCVYDDRFRPLLEALGTMKVNRASTVEFNPIAGDWFAMTDSHGIIARGKNRNEVIAAEVAWLESRMN